MRWALVFLVACGGGDGGGGSVDATVNTNGVMSEFSSSCKLTEGDEYLDIYADGGDTKLEIKWKKAVITSAGTYTTNGIVSDLFLFASFPGSQLSSASGMVTFSTYEPPKVMAGTFQLAVPASMFMVTGVFDCK